MKDMRHHQRFLLGKVADVQRVVSKLAEAQATRTEGSRGSDTESGADAAQKLGAGRRRNTVYARQKERRRSAFGARERISHQDLLPGGTSPAASPVPEWSATDEVQAVHTGVEHVE